jgi:hypothetical protein
VLPAVRWLSEYQAGWLISDLVAGMTLAAYAIPVSMAYASLAGMPQHVGIYGYLLGGLCTPRSVADITGVDMARWAEIATLWPSSWGVSAFWRGCRG